MVIGHKFLFKDNLPKESSTLTWLIDTSKLVRKVDTT